MIGTMVSEDVQGMIGTMVSEDVQDMIGTMVSEDVQGMIGTMVSEDVCQARPCHFESFRSLRGLKLSLSSYSFH
jgi:hypothetical protein